MMNLFNFLLRKNNDKIIPLDTIFDKAYDTLAIKILAVHIAISYIADTISKCNFNFYENGKMDRFSEESYLFNIGPNLNETASKLKRDLIFKLFLDKEALIFSEDGHLYLADSFFREQYPLSEDKFTNISIRNETETFDKEASEVFYFTLGENNVTSFIDAMYSEYKELVSYSFKSYKNSSYEKYKLKLEQTRVGDSQFQKDYEEIIKKNIKEFIENPKSVYPEFKGYTLEQIGSKNDKTDSTDALKLINNIFEMVSMSFKMPVSFLYGNMTNVKDLINSYLTFTIDPVKKMIEQEITKKHFKYDGYSGRSYCIVDTSNIYHTDLFEVADKVDKLIASGYACIDEVRERIGDQPLNEDFSKQHWMTKNYSKIQDLLNSIQDVMKGGG